ncbi:pitrilysin family protein [uncultured Jannaschia sp.]|uniref:M16 family metallopeptidase n=1 Tax=uncultured Jannaschia sp. TaxID=293347 RepID=UPI002612A102|nr:pitrilysin family protein [uncultured Jannaschia sp.]
MIPIRAWAIAAMAALPLPALAAVEIQEVTSPGGIEAWLVEEHSIPFIALELQFEGGAALDRPGKRGAVNLMTGLLEEGAAERDARAFAEATEDLAARFGFDAGQDSVSISAEFLTETTPDAIALLRDALISPRFDDAAVERVRDQVLAVLAQDASDPDAIASSTFQALSFPDHPYGSVIDGTVETVSALTADDLRDAHADALTRDRVRVGVTGDITAAELGPLLDKLLGDLPATGGGVVADADKVLEGGITVVDFPSPQSVVFFGHEGIDFDDPDYFPAYILNHILGGAGFESRLMAEVREKRGLTYGIGTFLAPRDHAAQWMGQFSSSNDKTAEAVRLVREEWARLASEGVSAAELERAKTYLTGAYPLRFDGNSRIAGILVGMQSLGLGVDYIPGRNDRIMAVTSEDIARVAARLLRPDDLHFVVVGQPDDLTTEGF